MNGEGFFFGVGMFVIGAMVGAWLTCDRVIECESGFWCGGAVNPCNDAGLPTWNNRDGGE